MKNKIFLIIFIFIANINTPVIAEPQIKLGKQIYQKGILSSGKPLQATQGNVPINGIHLKCQNCHRRSGFGSSEGGILVPPITGSILYKPKKLRRADLIKKLYQEVQPKQFWSRMRDPRMRPAYTNKTLALALREGIDPTGRKFNPLMPKYSLNDSDIANLNIYLKSLSSSISPGVDKSTIHFATVITSNIDSNKRKAMLDVMKAFFKQKNYNTHRELIRPRHSLWYKDDFYGAYRNWKLHLWELKGSEDTWYSQLKDYYTKQPVFALIGGISNSSWFPIHKFCETFEIPCLFPNTNLPVVSEVGNYSIYFSKGLILEAETIIQHINENSILNEKIIQIFEKNKNNSSLTDLFQKLESKIRIKNLYVEDINELKTLIKQDLFVNFSPKTVIIWSSNIDIDELKQLAKLKYIENIYLPSSFLEKIPTSTSKNLIDKLYFTYPYALPTEKIPRTYRIRAWLRSRKVEITDKKIQLNTYFTLTVVEHALIHIVENFSRDYFIESIEHETENALNPGIYPNLSLGPSQRFASKGCYIVKISEKQNKKFDVVSEWITYK